MSESIQYQKEMENSEETELDEETVILLRTPEIQALFKEYDETPKKGLWKAGKQPRWGEGLGWKRKYEYGFFVEEDVIFGYEFWCIHGSIWFYAYVL